MSRIFEALQQSESKRNDCLPESVLAVTDLLRAAEKRGMETVGEDPGQSQVLCSATGPDNGTVPIAESRGAETVSKDSGQNHVLRSTMGPDNGTVPIAESRGAETVSK